MTPITKNDDRSHFDAASQQKFFQIVMAKKSMITLETLSRWDRFYRANFVNSMSGFKSASLIGSVHEDGTPNLGIFSNIVHLGADPALIGFVNRPIDAAPHTLANIQRTGQFTINAITKNMIPAAHQTSAKYPASISEFEATGLTPLWLDHFDAPAVVESPLRYGLQLEEIIPIKQNGTFFVIGALQWIDLEGDLIESDGFIRLEKADIITSLGIDSYYSAHFEKKLPYAKYK